MTSPATFRYYATGPARWVVSCDQTGYRVAGYTGPDALARAAARAWSLAAIAVLEHHSPVQVIDEPPHHEIVALVLG